MQTLWLKVTFLFRWGWDFSRVPQRFLEFFVFLLSFSIPFGKQMLLAGRSPYSYSRTGFIGFQKIILQIHGSMLDCGGPEGFLNPSIKRKGPSSNSNLSLELISHHLSIISLHGNEFSRNFLRLPMILLVLLASKQKLKTQINIFENPRVFPIKFQLLHLVWRSRLFPPGSTRKTPGPLS